MVAQSPSLAERFVIPPEEVLAGRSRLMKFKRADLPVLVQLGIVPEDASVELLNGVIVHTDRSAVGEDILRVGLAHRKVVERLSDLRTVLNNDSRHVESQQPLACADEFEPQPDFMVVRGTIDDMGDDEPSAQNAFCVVEVADSSYERDSGQKLIGYAKAGIQQYIIINLRNRTAEVYANPDSAAGTYAMPTIVTEGQSLSLRVGDAEFFSVPMIDVLP